MMNPFENWRMNPEISEVRVFGLSNLTDDAWMPSWIGSSSSVPGSELVINNLRNTIKWRSYDSNSFPVLGYA